MPQIHIHLPPTLTRDLIRAGLVVYQLNWLGELLASSSLTVT